MKFLIVGPPLAGKTTFLKALDKKIKTINIFVADEFVEQIYQKNQPGYNLIKAEFGNTYLKENEVNKTKLSKAVLNDQQMLLRLNELIHPLIEYEFNENLVDVIAEIPLIISSRIKLGYDKIVLIKTSKDVLLKRLETTTRLINKSFIEFMINKWNDEHISFDYVIDGDNSLDDELNRFIDFFHLNNK